MTREPEPEPELGAEVFRRRGTGGALGGILYVVASGLCFGCMPIFARMAFASGIDVPSLLLLRFAIASACMWGLFAREGLALPRGRVLAVLVAMGALGYAGQAFCYFYAITMASVGLVSLLLYLYPALVAILARIVFGHRLSWVQVAAVAIALAGSALTIGRAGDGKPLGIALALLAAGIYSAYILTGSRIPVAVSPTASTAVITSAATLIFAGLAAAKGLHLPASVAGWGWVLAVALVSTVLAILFFFKGLERVGPVRASVYSTVELMCTLGLAAALLGEPLTVARVGGGVLIVAAVVLLAREELRSSPAAAAATPPALRRPSPAARPPTAEG
jgi:drug/metabolite transporter (DMT)-like permease